MMIFAHPPHENPSPAGKEEERAMFQQMQAMAQKQVKIEPLSFCNTFCLILI
jgi:hypothetical protein